MEVDIIPLLPKRFDIGGGAIAPSPWTRKTTMASTVKILGKWRCTVCRVGGGVLEGYNCDGEKLIQKLSGV